MKFKTIEVKTSFRKLVGGDVGLAGYKYAIEPPINYEEEPGRADEVVNINIMVVEEHYHDLRNALVEAGIEINKG